MEQKLQNSFAFAHGSNFCGNKVDENVKKLVLFGMERSGKSTIFKQLIAICDPPLVQSKAYRKEYSERIHQQCLEGMRRLRVTIGWWRLPRPQNPQNERSDEDIMVTCFKMRSELLVMGFLRETIDSLSCSENEMILPHPLWKTTFNFFDWNSLRFMDLLTEQTQNAYMAFMNADVLDLGGPQIRLNEVSSEIIDNFKILWSDPMIKSIVKEHYCGDNAVEYYRFQQLSTPYFWDRLDALLSSKYIPNEKDVIMHSQQYWTGGYTEIQKHDLKTKWKSWNGTLRILDFNPTQNQRYGFGFPPNLEMLGAEIMVFVASLQCYEEYIKIYNWPSSDIEMNCMQRQIDKFDELLNRIPEWFSDAHLVLLLNKKDLFIEKIERRPITTCSLLKDYDGPPDSVAKSIEYIQNVFVSRTSREVKTYVVNGTDKADIEVVCKDLLSLMKLSLREPVEK